MNLILTVNIPVLSRELSTIKMYKSVQSRHCCIIFIDKVIYIIKNWVTAWKRLGMRTKIKSQVLWFSFLQYVSTCICNPPQRLGPSHVLFSLPSSLSHAFKQPTQLPCELVSLHVIDGKECSQKLQFQIKVQVVMLTTHKFILSLGGTLTTLYPKDTCIS